MVTCALSFEELDSAALKTEVLRRSQPLLEWFLLQKHSCTETLCLLQVKWNLCQCRIHLVQVFLPKCCSDVFLLARNFLFKWICNMLHSCNCFDYCQDYIYLLKISLLFKIWWKRHRSWNSSLWLFPPPSFLMALNTEGYPSVPHFAYSDWCLKLLLPSPTEMKIWFGGQLSVLSVGRFAEGAQSEAAEDRFVPPQPLHAQVLRGISLCTRRDTNIAGSDFQKSQRMFETM